MREQSDAEKGFSCLEGCLERLLTSKERELIVEYYREEKGSKIAHRSEMAEHRKLTANALRIECCRIRARLRDCVHQCVEEK